MSNFKFKFREKEYELNESNCSGLINDEEKPVSNIGLDEVLRLLNQDENIDFDLEYYQEACPECLAGVKEKQKFFGFLEYHFYVFSKDGKYVISDIDKEYEGLSFNKLSRTGTVDDSYIVSLIICEHCGDHIVQIENCIV
ncbi:hypothetical protein C672_0926 [[Clostridium] bifermentans ATCC 638]|uniref:DUF3785 domain-containing protein n=1 Tax=Paraclostridium bifermentans ATCC 638 = DSM 14991 TaxID=1233171 RepID=T4VMU7_PARBF|nr:DUF3785 family protein [Paraclostridium bifermentans]EQK41987.1 hypothetical protein C672_0926 [[Clostridium] bifermentans ATCC 638] [Paraclostridium bifermentans ATCC 638 = DSM 14991]RIZ59302.1 DUF3785 domain-containing protein [Paraclostridium bifermentans]UAG18859.1 DUF3785 domain-containing protein [Paraclostridium bifermentans]